MHLCLLLYLFHASRIKLLSILPIVIYYSVIIGTVSSELLNHKPTLIITKAKLLLLERNCWILYVVKSLLSFAVEIIDGHGKPFSQETGSWRKYSIAHF